MNRKLEARAGLSRFLSVLGVAVAVALALVSSRVTASGRTSPGGQRRQAGTADKNAAAPAELAQLAVEIERRLKGCHERIAELGLSLLTDVKAEAKTDGDLGAQEIAVVTAKADYEHAKVASELAEMAVKEYEQGIFLQDEGMIQGEIKFAESESTRAKAQVEVMKERLVKIKEASKGSAADLAVEYTYEDHLADALDRWGKAKALPEQARFKLKILREYTKEKTIKELKAEVEKARAKELLKKVDWELAQGKLTAIKIAPKSGGSIEGAADVVARRRVFPGREDPGGARGSSEEASVRCSACERHPGPDDRA